MKKYINRQISDAVYKGLTKIFGEKGAHFAWGGLIILGIMIGSTKFSQIRTITIYWPTFPFAVNCSKREFL